MGNQILLSNTPLPEGEREGPAHRSFSGGGWEGEGLCTDKKKISQTLTRLASLGTLSLQGEGET